MAKLLAKSYQVRFKVKDTVPVPCYCGPTQTNPPIELILCKLELSKEMRRLWEMVTLLFMATDVNVSDLWRLKKFCQSYLFFYVTNDNQESQQCQQHFRQTGNQQFTRGFLMHHQACCIVLLPFTDGMDMDVLLDYMTCSFAFYQCWQTFSVIVISQMDGSAKSMQNSFKNQGNSSDQLLVVVFGLCRKPMLPTCFIINWRKLPTAISFEWECRPVPFVTFDG